MGGRVLASLLAAVLMAAGSSAAAKCNLVEVGTLPVHMEGLSPLVDAKINGHSTRLVADSGAFFSTLSSADAEKFELKALPVRLIYIQGVSGWLTAKIQTAEAFSVLGHTFKNIDFVAAPETFGRSVSGLLGQNFLNVTDTEYDLSNGIIRFFHADACNDAMLAYWDNGGPYSVIPISKTSSEKRNVLGKVSVNGVEITAQFDTGSPYSGLSLQGAMRVGIKKGDPRLKPGGASSGIGRRLNQTWIAAVDSFKIGDEEIRQTGLRVSEMYLPQADMLIGADFFLSHRVFVANSQQKLYLTYNGGPVFKLDVIPDATAGEGKAPPPAAPAAIASEPGQDPKNADGYLRRAEAFAARREYARAYSDFDRALDLAPKDPHVLYARAQVHAAQDQPKLALADLDEALKQTPADVDMLLSRGALRLKEKQLELAKADFEKARIRDPDTWATIGSAYAAEEYYPEALAEYDARLKTARNADDKAIALEDKCWVRAAWNQELEKALADCQGAYQLDAYERNFGFSFGFIYLRLGRYGDSIRELNRAIKGQPKLALAIYMRGVAKIRAGKAADGETDIKAATAIEPKIGERAAKLGVNPQGDPKPISGKANP